MTKPALGTDAAPIDAKVAVKLVTIKSTNERLLLFNCAMNITATASYSAVPSMFIVAPTGSTNLDISLFILFFSSIQVNVVGKAAVLDAVETAINNASIFDVNLN